MNTERRCPHQFLRSKVVCVACDRRERILEHAEKAAALAPIIRPQAPPQTIQRPYLDFQPTKPPPRPVRRKPGTDEAPFIPGLAIQPALIMVVVADRYAIDVDCILGPLRYQNIVEARITCYWLLRELCKLSYPLIGLSTGRDHSTVISGVRKCVRMREQSATYREITDALKREVEARAKGEAAA
jgi:hypothetical protein